MNLYKTSLDIIQIIKNTQGITDEQLITLMTRQGKKEETIQYAMNEIIKCNGAFHDYTNNIWLPSKEVPINMKHIFSLWLVLMNTAKEENEYSIWLNELIRGRDYTFAYVKNQCIYYVYYLLNEGSFINQRLFEERLDSKGETVKKENVRVIYLSELDNVLEKLKSSYPHMSVHMKRNGFACPDFEVRDVE